MKKGALFCLKGFIREPKPTKKGIRVLLGILGKDLLPGFEEGQQGLNKKLHGNCLLQGSD